MKPYRLALYRSADEQTAAVSAGAKLACPTGCGMCCIRTPPHVSVSDMAPVARAAIAAGEGEALLERARATGAGPCVLFAPGQLPGGCTVYAIRPIICRLFAFAAVRDKHGALELAVCREHTAVDPAAPTRAAAYLATNNPAPVFAELQSEAHDPDDGSAELVPINDALAQALERELLRAQYS
ncbi:MAG TPA: YkgJ family cysteine cluster protein [Kofleriaceae bacterium]|nr:YkgJ family cysteine cluster protein [Kofleriaceae bacterium]